MRVIKFRAWTGTEMIYDVIPWQWDYVLSRDWWKCEENVSEKESVFKLSGYKFKEIMEFTGLLDKNGKEIWEGDRLSWSAYGNPLCNKVIEVEWDTKNGRWNIPYVDETDNVWEVIGNRFEGVRDAAKDPQTGR